MRVEEVIKSVEEGVNDPHIFKVPLWQADPVPQVFCFKNVERNRVKDGKLR